MEKQVCGIIIFVFFLSSFGGWRATAYGQSCISIQIEDGTELERDLAEEAVRRVENFYSEQGLSYSDTKEVKLVFSDTVQIKNVQFEDALAVFNKSTKTIHLLHYESAGYVARAPFGLFDSPELYCSIICHELAHFYNSIVVPEIEPIADEFVAATVQFSLLPGKLREQLIENAPIPPITCPRDLTLHGYILGGSNFLIACYLLAGKFPHLLCRVLDGQYIGIKDPFLVHKD